MKILNTKISSLTQQLSDKNNIISELQRKQNTMEAYIFEENKNDNNDENDINITNITSELILLRQQMEEVQVKIIQNESD